MPVFSPYFLPPFFFGCRDPVDNSLVVLVEPDHLFSLETGNWLPADSINFYLIKVYQINGGGKMEC